jgi:trehalose 6-phosphate phosphatase
VPLPGALEVLAALADRFALVGVVSGRPVRFLIVQLAPVSSRLVLVGLYGLERSEDGVVVAAAGAEAWRPAVAEAVATAASTAPAGVAVEDKGLTVTLHARAVPERMAWVEEFAAGAGRRLGLDAHPGRLSVELRPPLRIDKGTVVDGLVDGLGAACYAGDDRGDLPVFEVLAARRAAGMATLAVAAASDEAPGELLAGADVVVDGPEGVLELFGRLAGH